MSEELGHGGHGPLSVMPQPGEPAVRARSTGGPAGVGVTGTGGPAATAYPRATATTIGRAWRALVTAVAGAVEDRSRLWVLETGTGTRPLFELPEDAYIVGVHPDGRQLAHNTRLDERVATDLVDYRPRAAGFDLITCWYVLDGVREPAALLDRFATWSGPDGLVVLGVPNPRSPRGVWARLTRRAWSGWRLTPAALRRRFVAHGFVPYFEAYFEDPDQIRLRRRWRITYGRWAVIQATVRVLSLGWLDAARTDYLVVFRRKS
jgi:hypothetical protein